MKIVSAAAMLAVSASMLGTSTYAWFTMNKEVTVQNLAVQAKAEGLISDKYPFKAGMILYSKIRPNLNKVAIARFDGICSADMYPLSVLPKANNVYITKLLSSKQFLDYAIKNSGRARMPKLNRET